MKKAVIGALLVAATFLLLPGSAGVAHADGIILWTGHGADNLPCATGAHWVLAPAFGITGAVLTVNGNQTTMVQNGNGSWAADDNNPEPVGTTASAAYTGPGDPRDQLQLSHCIVASTTPPSTTPPSTTPPLSTPPPSGGVSTGGGSTSGIQALALLVTGGALLAMAAGLFALRRRGTPKGSSS